VEQIDEALVMKFPYICLFYVWGLWWSFWRL